MTHSVISMGSLIPVGHQQMTLSNSTAVAINSTCQASHVLLISVETNDARMRDDGTDPTLNTGVIFKKDLQPYPFDYNGNANMKFQRSTGTCVVSLNAYKYFNVGR